MPRRRRRALSLSEWLWQDAMTTCDADFMSHRKLNKSPTTVEDPSVLKLPLTEPKLKSIALHFPLGLEVTARNMKGVTIKDALDAIHKQFKKRVSILDRTLCLSFIDTGAGRRRVREALPNGLRVGPRGVLHPLHRAPVGRTNRVQLVRLQRQEEEEQEGRGRGGFLNEELAPFPNFDFYTQPLAYFHAPA